MKRGWSGWELAACALVLVWVGAGLGCPGDIEADQGCRPNSLEACDCEDGLEGTRRCQEDRTFSACECVTEGDASDSGTGTDMSTADVPVVDSATEDTADTGGEDVPPGDVVTDTGQLADTSGEDLFDDASLSDTADTADTSQADSSPGDTAVELDSGSDTGDLSSDPVTDTADMGTVCPSVALAGALGFEAATLRIGGRMADETFAGAPFDFRYLYLSSPVPDEGACSSCQESCTVDGAMCSDGCNWWGCWQDPSDAPGRYIAEFITATQSASAVPMITYAMWPFIADPSTNAEWTTQLNDQDLLSAWIADYRFTLGVIAESNPAPVILHLEPFLLGSARDVNSDPSAIPVAVQTAGATECLELPNTLAGFGACLAAIADAEAPNVFIGYHAWAGDDVLLNTNEDFDLQADAEALGAFLRGAGVAEADLLIVSMAKSDAGLNDEWWDASNTTLPHFEQAFTWAKLLSEDVGLSYLWWQAPYGHLGLTNICDAYEDNRLDYIFDHPEEVAAAGALGVLFGRGEMCATPAEVDGGHFLTEASAYFDDSPPLLCPE